MNATEQPIIIVRRVRKVAGKHHGGSWKVAFADFAIAMMAFFLVMWLMAVASPQEKAAISEYFRNPSAVPGTSLVPSAGAIGAGGAANDVIRVSGAMDPPTGPGTDIGGATDAAEQALREQDRRQLEALERELEAAIEASQAMAPFKDQLLLDITPEGLRIQIVDRQNRPMFELGRAELMPYADAILRELVVSLDAVPNRLSLGGHTDETPYQGGERSYGNWELSADRANAARRALVGGGLPEGKVARVVGLGASVPFDKADPRGAVNRRISLIVMNRAADEAAAEGTFHAVAGGDAVAALR
ncbi:flagellar motor protein MotB [Luteimonas sp. RD2P54]|uniref:Flagellar motor protein MotB n=1 Tax=Luteimonas endophytica TaxID=3042023 RepID=A0ABT6J8D6_9GAMM|nr:flagellar motor protein MotB [Luteimonas endophytica]MDH5823092.1 flagellar motor protein MotB [Luteimonas endophytica]